MDSTQDLKGAAPNYRWLVIGLWLLCSVSGFMVAATLGIMLPAISSDLSLSPGQQGLLSSSAYWGNLVLAVPLSWWTSRYGPKLLTTVTLTLGTLLIFLQSWGPSFAVLLIGRLGFGFSIIARQPAQAILTHQWFQKREVILVSSLSNALFGLVVGGGLAAGPFVLAARGDNWRSTFLILGVLFVLLTVMWAVLGRDRGAPIRPGQELPGDAGLVRSTLAYRDLWVTAFGFMGAATAWSSFVSFFPTLMLDTYEIPLQQSGAVLALGVFIGGVAGLGLGYAVMRTGRTKQFLQFLGVLMAGTYVGMALTGSLPMLLGLSLLNGIAWGFWPILYTVPFHLPGIQPRQVAVALAFVMTATSGGIALGPLVTGFLQESFGSLRWPLLLVGMAPISVTMAGILLRTSTTARSRGQVEPAPDAGGTSPRPMD